MSNSGRNSGLFWGGMLILMGVLFLLDNFYILDFGDIVFTYWPLILIAIGIKIIMDKRRHYSNDDEVLEAPGSAEYEGGKRSDDGLSESNVFGDIDLRLTSKNFRGGSINNVFGDIKLDISEVKLQQRATRIYISGIFGDITVVTPKEIPIKVNTNAVAGDISIRGNKKDGLFPKLQHEEGSYEQAKEKLYIQSSIIFGSITVF
jgi:predicted membrane protein